MEPNDNKTTSWDKVNNWSTELENLKSIITKTELIETIKWGGTVFTLNGKNVLGIGGFKNYFTIWFFKGVFLKDEKKVLVNAQEGITKSLRQWRFYNQLDVSEELILSYIKEAIAIERAEKKINSSVREIKIPALLQIEFDTHPELLKAFKNFAPYKQKDFLEYIDSAKREVTKISRIIKIKPMILNNIALNDKYQ